MTRFIEDRPDLWNEDIHEIEDKENWIFNTSLKINYYVFILKTYTDLTYFLKCKTAS